MERAQHTSTLARVVAGSCGRRLEAAKGRKDRVVLASALLRTERCALRCRRVVAVRAADRTSTLQEISAVTEASDPIVALHQVRRFRRPRKSFLPARSNRELL